MPGKFKTDEEIAAELAGGPSAESKPSNSTEVKTLSDLAKPGVADEIFKPKEQSKAVSPGAVGGEITDAEVISKLKEAQSKGALALAKAIVELIPALGTKQYKILSDYKVPIQELFKSSDGNKQTDRLGNLALKELKHKKSIIVKNEKSKAPKSPEVIFKNLHEFLQLNNTVFHQAFIETNVPLVQEKLKSIGITIPDPEAFKTAYESANKERSFDKLSQSKLTEPVQKNTKMSAGDLKKILQSPKKYLSKAWSSLVAQIKMVRATTKAINNGLNEVMKTQGKEISNFVATKVSDYLAQQKGAVPLTPEQKAAEIEEITKGLHIPITYTNQDYDKLYLKLESYLSRLKSGISVYAKLWDETGKLYSLEQITYKSSVDKVKYAANHAAVGKMLEELDKKLFKTLQDTITQVGKFNVGYDPSLEFRTIVKVAINEQGKDMLEELEKGKAGTIDTAAKTPPIPQDTKKPEQDGKNVKSFWLINAASIMNDRGVTAWLVNYFTMAYTDLEGLCTEVEQTVSTIEALTRELFQIRNQLEATKRGISQEEKPANIMQFNQQPLAMAATLKDKSK